MELIIEPASPFDEGVRQVLEAHLSFAHTETPPEHVYALGVGALDKPSITLFAARLDGQVVGVAALRELDAGHGELKSMHTLAAARGGGVGARLLEEIVGEARRRGYGRVSLETGTMDAFTPARTLYQRFGFTDCPPFGEYAPSGYSVCMTMSLDT